MKKDELSFCVGSVPNITRLPLIEIVNNESFNILVKEFVYSLYVNELKYSRMILSSMICENILRYTIKKIFKKLNKKLDDKKSGTELARIAYGNQIISKENKLQLSDMFKLLRNPIAHGNIEQAEKNFSKIKIRLKIKSKDLSTNWKECGGKYWENIKNISGESISNITKLGIKNESIYIKCQNCGEHKYIFNTLNIFCDNCFASIELPSGKIYNP